jgi:hypothetical protein
VGRVLSVPLALMVVAWNQPAAAEPAAQVAFRAVLVKYDQRANAETDPGRLRTLAAERSAELAEVLGQGLAFNGWGLVLNGSEATPMGGIFVRLLDATLNAPRAVRPTYWNSGPGTIMRQAEISPKSPLHGPLALLKRGTLVVVSGTFFPGDNGGPFYESARISFQDVEVERARFRMPYFSIRIEEIAEVFPERRFP